MYKLLLKYTFMSYRDVNPDPLPPTLDDFQLAQREPYSVQETNETPEVGVFKLYHQAEALLMSAGEDNTVNHVSSVTTPDYFVRTRVTSEGTLTTYVRVSKPQNDGKGIGFPAFIESRTPNFDTIETLSGKFSTLFFAYDETDGVKLCGMPDSSSESGNPRVNDPDDITLANDVVDFLQLPTNQKSQLSTTGSSNDARLAALSKALANNARIVERASPKRIKALRNALIGGVAATATIILALVATKSGSSAEQAVQPDEVGNHAAANTLCNTNGVCVAGPDVPLESVPLAPGAVIARLPVETAYADAMGKIAIPGTSTLNPNHIVRSQEGIYSYPYPEDTTPLPGEGDCTFIEGNFNQGISAAFTTSEDFAKYVRLHVDDESTLELCKVPGAPEEVPGNLYIARGTS
jgi:hypothetical protein